MDPKDRKVVDGPFNGHHIRSAVKQSPDPEEDMSLFKNLKTRIRNLLCCNCFCCVKRRRPEPNFEEDYAVWYGIKCGYYSSIYSSTMSIVKDSRKGDDLRNELIDELGEDSKSSFRGPVDLQGRRIKTMSTFV